jgi:hypothetical protein
MHKAKRGISLQQFKSYSSMLQVIVGYPLSTLTSNTDQEKITQMLMHLVAN